MTRAGVLALSLLLLAGCMQDAPSLFPELKGRWAPEKGAKARALFQVKDTSKPLATPSLKELCEGEYVTFDKHPPGAEFAGAVALHRQGKRDVFYMVKEAKREGARIVLTGREPDRPLAGPNSRLEITLRNGEVAFADVSDQRGRSVRYDRFKTEEAVSQQRAGLSTIGDLFGSMLDLKPCA